MMGEDLSEFFDDNDFAVAASWTPQNGDPAQTASVLFDQGDDILAMGANEVLGSHYRISYPSTQLTGLDNGETVSLDGGAGLPAITGDYIVREVMQIEDGKITTAILGKLST